MRTIEVYDSFKPTRLLDVRFELSDKPEYLRTFRSSYASLYELMERSVWRDTRREPHRSGAGQWTYELDWSTK